ncbi:hypothetical protein JL720_2440 [Aureococcus anophagefferens]|nr:hypothetical protein JL720_2440 [Aureococcus anophagefferens]
MAAPRASSAAASQKLTLGLICRTLGVEDVDAILNLRALHLDGLRIDRVGNLEAFAGTLKELHLQRNRIASKRRTSGVPRRVLDLSGNALEAVPVSLPGASLTVLDLRGNAFGDGVPDTDRGRVLAPARAEELDGAAVERRGGAAPEARPLASAAAAAARRAGPRAPGRRARRLRALVGDRPASPADRRAALRRRRGPRGGGARLLRGPRPRRARRRRGPARGPPRRAPPPRRRRDGKENDGLYALDPAIERAFAGLAKFEGDADGALDATRATRTAARPRCALRWRARAAEDRAASARAPPTPPGDRAATHAASRARRSFADDAAAAAATRDARDLADEYDAAPARHDATRFDDLPDAGSDFSDSDDDVGAKGGR